MQLEVNGNIAAENADANAIKYALLDLPPDNESTITLHNNEGIYIHAKGVAGRGLTLYYINQNKNVGYASKNKKLKPRAVMRVMRHYLAGSELWRQDIAWEPMTDEAAEEQKQLAWKQERPTLILVLFVIAVFLPFMFFPLLAVSLPLALLFLLTDTLVIVGLVLWVRRKNSGNNKGAENREAPTP